MKALKEIRCPAAISLLMALLVPLLSGLFLIGIAFGERINRELDQGRALHTAEELLLVQYSRDLWKDFGLWAYEAGSVSLEDAQVLLRESDANLQFTATQSLYGSGEVKKQILRYMKLRAPVLFSKEALERIQEAARGRQALGSGSMLEAIRKQHAQQQADEKYAAGKELIAEMEAEKGSAAALPDGESRELPALPPGGAEGEETALAAGTAKGEGSGAGAEDSRSALAETGISDADLSFLTPFLSSFSRRMQPVYQAAGTENSSLEAYSPGSVESLAGALDRLLDAGIGIESERLSLAEYALLHCPGTVFFERQGSRTAELLSPDGTPFRELAEKRPAELEQLCSGLSSPGLASRWTEAMLLGLRFVPRYIAAGHDPALQARYRAWANFLSGALRVLSLGSASVPPEAFCYFIQAAHALYLASADVRTLKGGEGLPFWPPHSAQRLVPGLQSLPFYYRDYIRLILFTLSPDTLAGRLEKIIEKQYPGSFHTAAEVRLLCPRRTYRAEIAYFKEESDADQ